MQFSLFQSEVLQNSPVKSEGAKLREKMLREQKYQEQKAESDRLQRQWANGAKNRKQEDIMRKNKTEELNNRTPEIVVLVSCVSRKRSEPHPAQDLYCSDWFKKARIFAETFGDRWLILSALHGIIEPEEIIEPYDHTLYGQKKQERASWASRTARTLRSSIPPKSKIIILAGEIYREFLIPELADRYEIEIPLEGLGIGQQLRALIELNTKNE